MTLAAQIALAATPLSAYFYMLALFQSGRRPRVVSGPLDLLLLAIGVGGLVAFGPVGQVVIARVVGPGATAWHWAIWVVLLAVWTLAFSGWTGRRLAIYNIDRAGLDGAVRDALSRIDGDFRPTLRGYEDGGRELGVTVQVSARFLAGAVEAYGSHPEALIGALEPRLREALARIPRRPSRVAHALYGLACLVMLLPVGGFLMTNTRAREAVRLMIRSVRWW